jgi:hypothetical protein
LLICRIRSVAQVNRDEFAHGRKALFPADTDHQIEEGAWVPATQGGHGGCPRLAGLHHASVAATPLHQPSETGEQSQRLLFRSVVGCEQKGIGVDRDGEINRTAVWEIALGPHDDGAVAARRSDRRTDAAGQFVDDSADTSTERLESFAAALDACPHLGSAASAGVSPVGGGAAAGAPPDLTTPDTSKGGGIAPPMYEHEGSTAASYERLQRPPHAFPDEI